MDTQNIQKIRNVAVIAHVDHGKTTLIDALLKQTHVFRDNQAEMSQERILDSNDLEREKGITILAKNIAIKYGEYKINIIDTPGHADFSGEVERTLGMADGALLIIDSQEGPMPQTRFVLKKALELNLKVIVVINKIDKPFARIERSISRVSDLILDLVTKEEQLDFPILYAAGLFRKVFFEKPNDFNEKGDVQPLLKTIVDKIPSPNNNSEASFKMLISSLDYNVHLGRIIIGKIFQGKIKPGQKVILSNHPAKFYTIEKVFLSDGLARINVEEARAGDIVALAGVEGATIGQTIADPLDSTPLPSAKITEPTLHMELGPNTSPISGREGEFSTSRQIEQRLIKELETNLSLKFEKLENGRFLISGKGELHLAILLETLRREGFELEAGKPEVILKNINGVIQEPVEEVSIIVLNDYLGVISKEIGKRFGVMIKMEPISDTETEYIFHMPTRTIIGLRSLLVNSTRGTVIFNSQVFGYQPQGQPIPKQRRGVLLADRAGSALAFGLAAVQGRGTTFIEPGEYVYEGMIIGLNAKDQDIAMNVCKGKKLTNMRSKSSDGIIQLVPAIKLSLEQSLDFLEADELLEITPKSLRLRKKYLKEVERKRHPII